jgi:dTDP-4-amino-4,6-dideoxygalactose transaminase
MVMMNSQMIQVMRPSLPNADKLLPYLREIDQSRYYSNFGPLNSRLKKRFANYQKTIFNKHVHVITASSATLALELLISDLSLPPGSKILVPSFTFLATASAVLRTGHIPVAADIDPDSWMMTPECLPSTILHDDIAAVIPVAIFGVPQPAEVWGQWSRLSSIPVIIDAASAFGAQSTDTNVPVAISLHATKSLSAGEGGLILTENEDQARRLTAMSNFGIGGHGMQGATNAKLSEYHAAVCHAHFDAWPETSSARMHIYQRYKEMIINACSDGIRFQRDDGLVAPTMMLITFIESEMRELVEKAFFHYNIETRRWYQPLIQNHEALAGVRSPYLVDRAKDLASRLLGLPFYLDISTSKMERIVYVLKSKLATR